MNPTENIMKYILETYHPEAVILYGSYAEGTETAESDFDALVLAAGQKVHDMNQVGGVALDVFVFPPELVQGEFDPADFVQVYDGKLLLDRNGAGALLIRRVREYISRLPPKTAEELREELDWCRKMLRRSLRGDAEAYYRWHWLLADSLEIYFDVLRRPWFGPKKALRLLESEDPAGFALYSRALGELSPSALQEWIMFVCGRAAE